ncbi:major facilitator superfamily domain-containing protein [Kockovaella imperatae]|uniref:Major facilitator superfamily domain-containing protein n=1 Tax=Kockovaella imperatae TaxID=4999 RepID=A0A1Y1UQZ5_9TREE|nr:major facilitator superfamily domain-containing protein [Kockovaella imperatae]ORX40473.1 major facilitator superfamily domain-containing protein [Kockovaella imperatae]
MGSMFAEDDISDEEYKRVKRKTDLILIPLMFWMYGIQQSDKTGLATMNIFGLQTDTHMHGREYSLLTVMFYVAYAIFEFPFNYLMQRLNIGKTLAVFMFLWGIVVFVQAFFKTWAEFMVFRTLQGMLECTISPGFNILIAKWYTSREHSSRALCFQSANALWGIPVNLTFYGVAKYEEHHPGSFRAWRSMSLFLGTQTLIASVLAWFFLGTPNDVRWLTKREKVVAQARVLRNHAGTDKTGTKGWNWDQAWSTFADPVLYFQFCITFLACIVNGALTTFGTQIQTSFGFSPYQVVLYDNVRNTISTIWFLIIGISSTRYLGIRMYWMIVSTAVVFIAMLVIALLPIEDQYRWPKLGCYWLTNFQVIPSFSAWALISSNTAGRTKISVLSAMVFIAYCTGNIAGSQVMKPKDAPHYVPGVITMSTTMGVSCLVITLWRLYLVRQNKKKAEIVAAMGLTPEEAERRGQELGAQDVTDVDNPFFRYSM